MNLIAEVEKFGSRVEELAVKLGTDVEGIFTMFELWVEKEVGIKEKTDSAPVKTLVKETPETKSVP